VRDRAFFLGFADCLYRSALVALDHHRVAEHRDGVTLSLAWSKTGQESPGSEKGITDSSHLETCPVRALKEWAALAGLTDAPSFRPVTRHGCAVSSWFTGRRLRASSDGPSSARNRDRVRQRRAETVGPRRYAEHPLCSRFTTRPAVTGSSTHDLMRPSGHTREETLRKCKLPGMGDECGLDPAHLNAGPL
jgi:hypothetical protein